MVKSVVTDAPPEAEALQEIYGRFGIDFWDLPDLDRLPTHIRTAFRRSRSALQSAPATPARKFLVGLVAKRLAGLHLQVIQKDANFMRDFLARQEIHVQRNPSYVEASSLTAETIAALKALVQSCAATKRLWRRKRRPANEWEESTVSEVFAFFENHLRKLELAAAPRASSLSVRPDALISSPGCRNALLSEMRAVSENARILSTPTHPEYGTLVSQIRAQRDRGPAVQRKALAPRGNVVTAEDEKVFKNVVTGLRKNYSGCDEEDLMQQARFLHLKEKQDYPPGDPRRPGATRKTIENRLKAYCFDATMNLRNAEPLPEVETNRDRAPLDLSALTDRQRKICDLLMGGLTQEEVAAEIGVDQSTVSRENAAIATALKASQILG
jgi:hypothetical protein